MAIESPPIILLKDQFPDKLKKAAECKIFRQAALKLTIHQRFA